MKDSRPVNIDIPSILSYNLPLPGITSIIHRISGLVIFLAIPFLLWGLDASISSEESFNTLKECMGGFLPKLIAWGILSGLIYHFVAGIKHLLMDSGIGETLEGGRAGAKVVIAVSVVLILAAGGWIFL